ncbi:MAG TPA: hypothetical protein VE860_08390 [Chthoniobacterales bacterium]|nr:hypothetical protein [Chthoniobacterales bacterium]
MDNLGWLYENGKGVAQAYGKAREWFQKAADAGNTDAMAGLGLYDRGLGVAQDYGKFGPVRSDLLPTVASGMPPIKSRLQVRIRLPARATENDGGIRNYFCHY